MNFTRFSACSSCGGRSITFKLDRSLTQAHLNRLIEAGFVASPALIKSGILYVDNQELILHGPFGSDRLAIKCKIKDCEEKIKDIEMLLQQME